MSKSKNWDHLDNAAVIFPAASGGTDTQVFRISCELFEDIDQQILQESLKQTLESFHMFRSVLKRGLFWYYLEESALIPEVHEENTRPCSKLYHNSSKNLLIDVSYYRKRINLELFHVLADGTGALLFLRTLVSNYLTAKHGLSSYNINNDASSIQMADDSFRKYYTGAHPRGNLSTRAFRITGRKYPDDGLKIITGLAEIKPLLDESHRMGTTLTALLCTYLIESIWKTMPVRTRKYPIRLAVPVNLRSHFPSESARNFFSIINVEYDYSKGNGTKEDIIDKVSSDLKQGLAIENLSKRIDTYSAVEHNTAIRGVPLIIKNIALKFAYKYSRRSETAGISNLGRISMPEEISQFIRSFDVYSGTDGLQVCICTFGGRISISFSSPFESAEIPRCFFKSLSDIGAEIEITANPLDEEEEAEK
jgi:NRPS condensation-like uncharacterized protein